jgi:steroid 5-alpha reductase family enzyme
MKTSLKELLFAFFAFTLSFSVAYITEIKIVKDAVLIAFLIQWALFIPAYIFQTEKFYDLSGSLTYISVVSFCFYSNYESSRINLGNIIISSLIIMWAIRLGSFLFIRIKKAGEDIRFREIKKSPSRFFMTWTLQGMWVSLCSACALAGIANGIEINSYFYVGIVIFVIGFTTEIIADNQKSIFRKDLNNKDKFISSGLWKYSRHPNYLGEITLWLGISIISFSSLAGWELITLISPIFTYLLLVYVSGIRILDYNGNKKWGHLESYKDYRKNTPRLIGFL